MVTVTETVMEIVKFVRFLTTTVVPVGVVVVVVVVAVSRL